MLNVKALSWSLALTSAITFLLCILYGLVAPPEYHAAELLEKMLPGFRWLTLGGFLIGLVESAVFGAYHGLLIGWFYNFFHRRGTATP